MSFLRTICVGLLALSGFLGAARAAEPSSFIADKEVFFPFPPDARGGGVAALGKTSMELVGGLAPDAVIKLSGSTDPVQGAWWFPGHLPLTSEQAMLGDPRGRITMQVRAAKPVRAEATVAWRIEGEEGETNKSATLSFGPDKSTDVELPLPALGEGKKITGLIIGFTKAGDYQIRKLALGRESTIEINPIAKDVLRSQPSVTLSGRVAGDASSVTIRFTPQKQLPVKMTPGTPIEKRVDAKGGKFELAVASNDVPPGFPYDVTAEPTGKPDEVSPARRLFVFPQLTGKKSAAVTRQGPDFVRDGKRFGFIGTNYTLFGLGLSNHSNFETIAHDVLQMKDWGVHVVRVPMNFGFIQPAEGVFPDNPQWAELFTKHNLDNRFMEQFDYFMKLLAENDMYLVVDWHDAPVDPYRYFMGGRNQDRDTGKPGEGISWLAETKTARSEFDLENPKHLKALTDTHRWMAGYLKGNPNVLGFEVPFNEPHSKTMAIEANWRRVTDLCARAVNEGDPDRMTFSMVASWGHNNILPSATWMPPDRVTGAAPHFYQANGPVPLRPDAKNFKSPWLARDNAATFGWSFPAVTMPLSAVQYPFFNGETGFHGYKDVLPDHPEAARVLVEAQLFQEYAAGMAGRLEWTLWATESDYLDQKDMYREQFRRFSPVYAAGPLDRNAAEVAFIQHPSAIPTANGHNFACVPLAKVALDAHLSPVHYLSDDQFRYLASAELAVGLEQVVDAAENLKYKAYIVDRRHLDPRVEPTLKAMGAKALFIDNADDLTPEMLTDFLTQQGITVDTKTPRQIQLAEGPAYLMAYKRLEGGDDKTRIFPHMRRAGSFELFNEAGSSVYKGTAAELAEKGVEIDLPLWRTAIFRIEGE